MTSGWQDLRDELDAWAAAGRTATFWWRDDDAVRQTPALERLLDVQQRTGVPLALAVIPAGVDAGLARRLGDVPGVSVVQHGFSHENHAAPGGKKAELAVGRDRSQVVGELAAGRERLANLFGERSRPLLVPPWNRIDPDLVPLLGELGFDGVSTFAGTNRADCHVDIIEWKGSRGFVGEGEALAKAVRHLAARRRDDSGPTGLLTHHLVHDEACWTFIEAFIDGVGKHAGARWIPLDEVL